MDGFYAACISNKMKKLLQPSEETWKCRVVTWVWGHATGDTDLVSEWWNCTLCSFTVTKQFFLLDVMTGDGYGWPDWWLIFGKKMNADKKGCCLSLHRNMIHVLVTWGFPSFHWLWQESVYGKRFFTKRGGRLSLSSFAFPSQLASLRGKSNSVGNEVGHYEQSSRLPNVWWRDKKGPDDLLFAPHVVVTSSLNPLKRSKGNELNAAWIQTLKIWKSKCIMGDVFNQGGSGAGLEAVPTLEPVLCISTVKELVP